MGEMIQAIQSKLIHEWTLMGFSLTKLKETKIGILLRTESKIIIKKSMQLFTNKFENNL